MAPSPRFAFVVHALSPLHRRVLAVRAARPGLFLGLQDGTQPGHVLEVCRVGIEGVVEGIVVAVPMEPGALLSDQARALECIVAAVQAAGPVDAVGLGALCAVVAGRGEALAERLDVPVTNGGAATAWALLENTRAVLSRVGTDRPVAVLGARGPVGAGVAALLTADGVQVRVDHPRAGRGLDVERAAGPEAAVQGCRVVVGAATTGAMLQGSALGADAIVIDVAIPGTIIGRPPPGVQVLAGEAMHLPQAYTRGFWGWVYHLLAGYGPSQVFACLVEPLVLSMQPEIGSFALGRTLMPERIQAFGAGASALGFEPRLARGWAAFPVSQIPLRLQARVPG
jgi:predicted amino acid dehydrogenase